MIHPKPWSSTIYTVPSLRANKILIDSLRSLKPDLVHASLAISPLDFRLPEICAELDLPLVATFHQPFDLKRRNLASSTQQLTYQIYAPSLADYNQVIIFSNIQNLQPLPILIAPSVVWKQSNNQDGKAYRYAGINNRSGATLFPALV